MASSDLKSCYDRIVHTAASLSMQRVGISPQIVKTMFETIQQCEHKIRTAYGDSTSTYGPYYKKKYKHPIMGVGQGNGAGPQIWSLISAVLFLAMRLEGFSTKFVSKLTKEFIDIVGYMYVDDMDLIQIKPHEQWQSLMESLQLTLAYWNKLVKATGGALEPSKSGWFAFRQVWDPITGEYKYVDVGKNGDISAKDKDGKSIPLGFIPCTEVQEMVGVRMGPTGNQIPQIEKMIEKAHSEASFITKSRLEQPHVYTAINHSILPSLIYPLPCMTITNNEGKRILRPLLSAALPKMGVIPTLGYDFVHGSSTLYGLGIQELYHTCFAKQLEMFIQHSWKNSSTGKLIRILLEGGCRVEKWLLTENTWLRGLRRYAIDHNIFMDIREKQILPHRENDKFLMDVMDHNISLTPKELKAINV